jgi:hypothetical protein
MKFLILLLLSCSAWAESLRYTINWPSGLSLGEATLNADRGREQLAFDLTVDASVPGFAVRDHAHSTSTTDFCSTQLDKSYSHGRRKAEERVIFDQQRNKAERETLSGGGKSEISVPSCARDALTFLQFARRELAQGRLAPQQAVIFGAPYQVRMEYTGTQGIRVGEEHIDADRIVATIKGPSSEVTVELFFSRDAARTPVLAKVPVALGTLTVELIR